MFNYRDIPRSRAGKAHHRLCTLLFSSLILIQFVGSEAFPIGTRNLRLYQVSPLFASIEEKITQPCKEIEDKTYKANLRIAELANKSTRRNLDPAKEAIELLRSLEFPDTVSYNSVLKALAKTSSPSNKNAAEQASALLEEMENRNTEQRRANQEWYRRLSEDSLDDEEMSTGAPRVTIKPNFRTYSTVMDACARLQNIDSAQRAQELLERLKEKYEATGDLAFRPSIITYNTVINGWAKAGAGEEGAIICENLLKDIEDFADTISYNAVIHAWARSDVPDAGERAEKILRSMETVRPNVRTYNTVIHAWSRSACNNASRHAHRLLREMEGLAEDDKSMTPDFFSYSSVVNAFALAKSEPLKAHTSFLLLQRMNKLGKANTRLSANLVVYNTALNACATSCPIQVKLKLEEEGREKTLPSLPLIVRTLYDQVTQDVHFKPDHVTYGTVLKAVANLFLGEPDQVEFGKKVFQDACESGQVSAGVVLQLRQAVPSDVFCELIPEKCISPIPGNVVSNLPEKWVCNLRESTRKWGKRDV